MLFYRNTFGFFHETYFTKFFVKLISRKNCFRKKRQIPNYAGEEYDDGRNTYYDDNLGLIFDNAEMGKN